MTYPREIPLERCPDPVCRRSGLCRSTYAREACRRFFMTDDEWREEFACYLERLHVEWGGDPRDLAHPPREPSLEEWADLYNAIAERAATLPTENDVVPKWARRRT